MFESRKLRSGNFPTARLAFGDPEPRADAHLAYVDGASRGNPGPASYAVILRAPDGRTKFEIGKYLGRATNNVAEYYALITALDYAAAQGIARLRVRSDSLLLVRQMQGRYKVKSADLRPLHERAQKLARGLEYFAIEHVPREQNSAADALANQALDQTAERAAERSAARGVSRSDAALAHSPAAGPSEGGEARISKPSGSARRSGRAVRARYAAGVLQPLEALDLAEGEIVDIEIARRSS